MKSRLPRSMPVSNPGERSFDIAVDLAVEPDGRCAVNFRQPNSGLLVVGGFNMRDEDLLGLGRACPRHFRRTRPGSRASGRCGDYFARPQLRPVPILGLSGKRVDHPDAPTVAHFSGIRSTPETCSS